MKKFAAKLAAGAVAAALTIGAAGTASAEMQAREFKVVGTWSFLDHWKEREGPFWNEHLPKVSGVFAVWLAHVQVLGRTSILPVRPVGLRFYFRLSLDVAPPGFLLR